MTQWYRKTPKSLSKEAFIQTGETQKWLCYYCEIPLIDESVHVEHKTPKSKGGTSKPENLVLSCAHCNLEKATLTATEYFNYRIINQLWVPIWYMKSINHPIYQGYKPGIRVKHHTYGIGLVWDVIPRVGDLDIGVNFENANGYKLFRQSAARLGILG